MVEVVASVATFAPQHNELFMVAHSSRALQRRSTLICIIDETRSLISLACVLFDCSDVNGAKERDDGDSGVLA
jgi:hypothetical protein